MDPTGGPDERMERVVEVENAVDGYLESFDANGVDYFFNSPGTEFAPFWEQFAHDEAPGTGIPTSKHGVGYVGCRHEELAIHMAMGYTLMTGRPQVVGFHVNVGSLHAAMSIHGAYHSRIPMVLVTSHADTHEGEVPGGTPGSHYLNFNAPGGFEAFFERYVKWMAHPERTVNATRYLARAFRVARSAPGGPVLVNLSRELLYDEGPSEARVVRAATATPPSPSPTVIGRVADELAAADNPLLVAGMPGLGPGTADDLVALAERLEAPVIETPKWHHAFPVEHPLSLGDRTFADHYLGKDVDLVLVVDSKRPWYPPEGGAPEDATVVMLSPEPEQAKLDYWNYPADLLVSGDPATTLPALLEAVPQRAAEGPVDWRDEHDALRTYWRGLADEGAGETPVDPFWLCGELDELLPDDAVLVEETTVHKGLVNNLLEARDRSYVGAGRALAGGRGGGLGMALGAKLAAPDRPVVALVGDGAYNYNPVSAALGAARQHRLPFMTVVFDNSGYRSQQGSVERTYPEGRAATSGRYPGSSIEPHPDYGAQAAAYDGFGAVVEDPADLVDAVEGGLAALAEGRAAVVDVVVESESPRDGLEPPT